MAHRQRLPNLKICVDNTETSDESDPDIKRSSSSDEEDTIKVEPALQNVLEPETVILSVATTSPTQRRFLTKDSVRNENDPGLKEERRRHKFGTLSNPKHPITDVDLKNLYKSLGINIEKISEDPNNWKLEAIRMKGVENMTTQEVMNYFSDYDPKNVDWLDDITCNVMFTNKLKAAKALIHLSSSFTEVRIAESIVDEQLEAAREPSPPKGPKIKEEKVTEISNDASKRKQSKESNVKSSVDTTSARPAVLDEPGDAMELDFDEDNFDLTEEDPIDKDLTSSKISKNQDTAADEVVLNHNSGIAKTSRVKNGASGKVSGNDNQKKNKKEEEGSKSKNSRKATTLSKKKALTSKPPKDTKMDVDIGSGYDSSSSSSSSSSSGSSSSSSSSSSDSDSDSSSSSSSSSSNSSSSSSSSSSSTSVGHGNAAGDEKKKKRKTKSQRDQAAAVRSQKTSSVSERMEDTEIPWPPGYWRLGNPHAKADYIFMRYAGKEEIINIDEGPGGQTESVSGSPDSHVVNSRKRRSDGTMLNQTTHSGETRGERKLAKAHSRLAGRLGKRKDEENSQSRKDSSETDNRKRDHRQRPWKDGDFFLKAKGEGSGSESDDEMDYGAELEKLMNTDEPLSKKRFMRMRADDEEEEIARSKRYAQEMVSAASSHLNYPEFEDKEDEEGFFEGDDEDGQYGSSQEEEERPVRGTYVDLDNVEDDDPFNLFGTSKSNTAHIRDFNRNRHKFNDRGDGDDDNEDDDIVEGGHSQFAPGGGFRNERRKLFDLRKDMGRSNQFGDLRDKLKNRRKRENRRW